jgi:hypothetical protein
MSYSASDFTSGNALTQEYVKAHGPQRGIITGAKIKEFKDNTGSVERRPAITLDLGECEKDLVLNKTNLKLIAASYGDSASGKPLVVGHDPGVTFGGRLVGGLKVRVPTAKAAAPAAPAAAADDDDIPF